MHFVKSEAVIFNEDFTVSTSKADENNPLLSTPVATIAISLFRDAVQVARTAEQMKFLTKSCVDLAEGIVTELQGRGHLPPAQIETEEPKADDATLVLRGLMLGLVRWVPYGQGDPRGEIYIGGDSPALEWRGISKLVKGIPTLTDEMRTVLTGRLAPLLRKL